MHVRAAVLEREERGVEPGQAVGVRHAADSRASRRRARRVATASVRCITESRGTPLSSNARSTAEPRHTMCCRAGDPLPRPGGGRGRGESAAAAAVATRWGDAPRPRARQLTSQAPGSNAQGGLPHEAAERRAPGCCRRALLRLHRRGRPGRARADRNVNADPRADRARRAGAAHRRAPSQAQRARRQARRGGRHASRPASPASPSRCRSSAGTAGSRSTATAPMLRGRYRLRERLRRTGSRQVRVRVAGGRASRPASA